MGSKYSISRETNKKIIKFLKLNNSNLALLRDDDIEIISHQNLESLFIIDSDINNNDLIQTKNGNLVLCSRYKIIVISLLENNTYNFKQTIMNNKKPIGYKILEIKDDLFCFEEEANIHIYHYNSNNEYTHSTNVLFHSFCYSPIYLDTNELIYISNNKITFLNLETWNNEYIEDILSLSYSFCDDIICKLNNNKILVADNNYFYVVDILNHNIISKIEYENNNINTNNYIVIKGLKSDEKGNIMMLKGKNHSLKICKGGLLSSLKVKDIFSIYKYNNLNFEKIYEMSEKGFRIHRFIKNSDNEIIFDLTENESHYIKVLNINL